MARQGYKVSFLKEAISECANYVGTVCIKTNKQCHVMDGCEYFYSHVAPLTDSELEYKEYLAGKK